MKKLSKLLLVTLTVVLLATTVFSTMSAASFTSDGETSLVDAAKGISLNRKVEDFTGEEILYKENIVPGEAYPADEISKENSSDLVTIGKSKYGVLTTAESKTGNRYAKLYFDRIFSIDKAAATEQAQIFIDDKQDLRENDYIVYEWDMTTDTQYPVDFTIEVQNSNSSSIGDSVKLAQLNATGDKLVIGDQEYALGGAGTWNHFTVVIELNRASTNTTKPDYRKSVGLFFMNGEKVGEFTPVTNASRKFNLGVLIGYYKTARVEVNENVSICVDNVVSTSAPVGHKGGADDKLQNLFLAENPVTNLAQLGSAEVVWSDTYQVPAEPTFALRANDGSLDFSNATFADAYADYKAGGYKWLEVYADIEGAVDAPLAVALFDGATFTDTLAGEDGAYLVKTAERDGVVYKVFTKETEKKLNVQFFGAKKDTAEAALPLLTLSFEVGTIPTIPEELAITEYFPNVENPKTVYQTKGDYVYYLNGQEESALPLVTDALLADADVVCQVYPKYELTDLAFEVATPLDDGTKVVSYFADKNAFVTAVNEAVDGAVVTLRARVGIATKLTIKDKTLSLDLAGNTIYPDGTAMSPFALDNATLYLYSSVEGASIYTGFSGDSMALVTVAGDASALHIGYQNAADTAAYRGNLTVHTPTVLKATAPVVANICGLNIKVVGSGNLQSYGVIELSGANCTNTTVNVSDTTIYNTFVNKNILSISNIGETNAINFKDTVIYVNNETVEFVHLEQEELDVTKQSITLDGVTYYGKLAGATLASGDVLALDLVGTVEATELDDTTIRFAEGAMVVNNNKLDKLTVEYFAAGAYGGAKTTQTDISLPALAVYLGVGVSEDDFCKLTWDFDDEGSDIVELWVRGVVPAFRGQYPVSKQHITYTHEGMDIQPIADGATELTVGALEVALLENLNLAQNIEIVKGMRYKLHIPVTVPVASVVVGDKTINLADMALSEDGTMYIVEIGQFSLRDLVNAKYAFVINLVTVRETALSVSAEVIVLDYFRAIYTDETVAQADQKMVTAFLKYAQSAGSYLGVDTTVIGEIIAGKPTDYYLIESEVKPGALRTAFIGVRMNLVEIPQFVFYIREGYTGTVVIGGESFEIADGKYGEKNYVLYTPASYAELGKEIQCTVGGAEAAFSLTTYLMGVREEIGTVPTYILDLYQFYAATEKAQGDEVQE